jgi:hypothetical protein
VREALPVQPADGEDRPQLDGDLEHVASRASETQEIHRQDEVPCRRNREELGQAFDDAEQACGEIRKEIHIYLRAERRPRLRMFS